MNIPFSLGLINFIMKNSSLYLQMKLSIIEAEIPRCGEGDRLKLIE